MKREITLMVYVNGENNTWVNEIAQFCSLNEIKIVKSSFRYDNYKTMYDFVIEGNTNDYSKLKNEFGDKLYETYYAELGNILDLDKETFEEWVNVLNLFHDKIFSDNKLSSKFLSLLKNLDDVSKIIYLKKYILSDFAHELVDSRISVLTGQKNNFEIRLDREIEKETIIKLLTDVQDGKYTIKNEDIESIKQFLITDSLYKK
jgi:hypothetical protein